MPDPEEDMDNEAGTEETADQELSFDEPENGPEMALDDNEESEGEVEELLAEFRHVPKQVSPNKFHIKHEPTATPPPISVYENRRSTRLESLSPLPSNSPEEVIETSPPPPNIQQQPRARSSLIPHPSAHQQRSPSPQSNDSNDSNDSDDHEIPQVRQRKRKRAITPSLVSDKRALRASNIFPSESKSKVESLVNILPDIDMSSSTFDLTVYKPPSSLIPGVPGVNAFDVIQNVFTKAFDQFIDSVSDKNSPELISYFETYNRKVFKVLHRHGRMIDTNAALAVKLRKVKKTRDELREKLISVREERKNIALEMEKIRTEFNERMEELEGQKIVDKSLDEIHREFSMIHSENVERGSVGGRVERLLQRINPLLGVSDLLKNFMDKFR